MSTQSALDECLERVAPQFTPVVEREIRDRDFNVWPWFGFGVEAAVIRSCLGREQLRQAFCGLGECNEHHVAEAILYCMNRQLNGGACEVEDLRFWQRSGPLSGAERLPTEQLPRWAAFARHDQVVRKEVVPALRVLDLLADMTPVDSSEFEGYPFPEWEKLVPLAW